MCMYLHLDQKVLLSHGPEHRDLLSSCHWQTPSCYKLNEDSKPSIKPTKSVIRETKYTVYIHVVECNQINKDVVDSNG